MKENTNLQSSTVNAQSQGDTTQSAEFKVSNPKNKFKIIFMIFLFIILIIGGYIFFENRQLFFQDAKRCQAIARICKDGTMAKPGIANCSQICPEDSISPTPTQKPITDEAANWKIYTNKRYSFSLKYPKAWILKENGSNSIWISNTNDETLIIGVKNVKDTVKITKSGIVVAKDLTKRGTVNFLQKPIEKDVLVFNRNDMSVMYDRGREIPRENFLFTLSLQKTNVCLASVNISCPKILSSDSENIADQILSTFKFEPNMEFTNVTNRISRSNSNIIGYIPDFALPKGIEKTQLNEPQKIDDTYFMQFLKGSMNVSTDSNVQRSGVLYAKDGDKSWKIFYEITDLIKNSPGKNNPYDFWKESNTYYTVIVDVAGGGSGEGQGKLISIDVKSKQWKIIDCFYYTTDSYMRYLNSLSQETSLSEAVKAYIGADFQKYEGDYIYDKTLNKFAIDKRIEDYCTALNLSL